MTNSLLTLSALPDFLNFKNADVSPATQDVLKRAQEALNSVTELAIEDLNWENSAKRVEDSIDDINRIWSTVSHLNAVENTPDLRKVYEENQQIITDFYTEMGHNKALYKVFQGLTNGELFESFNQAQKCFVWRFFRG